MAMALGMEVGLGPGDFVLDGDQPRKESTPTHPIFWPTSIVGNRLDGWRRHLVWK